MFPIRNVFIGFGVDVLFSQSEVDDMNAVVSPRRLTTQKKVFRFDIAINEMLAVDVFQASNELNGDQQNRL